MTNYRDYFERIAPPWLAGYWGQRLWGVYALMSDLMAEGMSQATKAHMLKQDTSPDDALPRIGSDRRMPKYAGETNDQYRARLNDAWDAYELGGTAAAITTQLGHFGLDNVVVRSQHDGWTFENPQDTSQWSRFVVVVEQTHPWSASTVTYGSGYAYGPGLAFGIDASPDEITTLRGIVDKWKPGHSHWPYILIIFAHEYFGDPALLYGGGAVYGGSNLKLHNA